MKYRAKDGQTIYAGLTKIEGDLTEEQYAKLVEARPEIKALMVEVKERNSKEEKEVKAEK